MSIRDLINELALFDNELERELPWPDDAQRRFPGYRPLHEDTYQRRRPGGLAAGLSGES